MKKFSVALAIKKKTMVVFVPQKAFKLAYLVTKMKFLAPVAPLIGIAAAPAAIIVGAVMNIKNLAIRAGNYMRRELCLASGRIAQK